MTDRLVIGNCSELIAVSSDHGRPLRGKKQNELSVIPGGCIVVEDGLIQDFGIEEDLIGKYADYAYFDSKKHIIMPAFVDPHTHLVFAGSREEEYLCRLQGEPYLSTLEKGYGIFSTVKATQNATEEDLFLDAIDRIHQFQKQGTVGLEIKSGYGLDLNSEIKILTVIDRIKKETRLPICRTFLAAHALPAEYKNDRDNYIELICQQMIPTIASKQLADCIDVFCEKGVFTAKESYQILSIGKEMGLKPKIHTDEFASIGGLSVATDLGAISADHLIESKEKELHEFSKKNGVAVILPGTSFALKIPDLAYGRKIIDLEIPLAIGTDFNPGTCMCFSMQMMMELSVLKYGLSCNEAINASTINAAFASGLDEITGSIEIGKRADLVVYSVSSYKQLPYRWGINKLDCLFIEGKRISFAY